MTGADSHRRAISTALASLRRVRRMSHSAEVAISDAAAQYSAVTREAANWGDPHAVRHTRYVVPDDGRPITGNRETVLVSQTYRQRWRAVRAARAFIASVGVSV